METELYEEKDLCGKSARLLGIEKEQGQTNAQILHKQWGADEGRLEAAGIKATT
jgi:hypothetical protein